MKNIGPKSTTTQNLLVEVENEITVQGTTADDAEFTDNPLVVGGVYLADPTADTLADGYAGNLLLTDQRRVATEDRTYDSATDANKQIPVFIPQDRYSFADLSGTQDDSDLTYSYYVDMQGYSFFSIQYIEGTNDGYQTLKVYASNEDVADITAATYTDVTNDFFGSTTFITDAWLERDTHCSCKFIKVEMAITGMIATDSSVWTLYVMKKGA